MESAADPFRKSYRKLAAGEVEAINRVKDGGEYLLHVLDTLPESRERALAKTRLEECVMWAVKALTG